MPATATGISPEFTRSKPFTWYVDSVSGNDGYTGKTPAQAFATIAKLLTVLQAGHRVRLARGSTWHEEILLSSGLDRVAFRAYGSGDAPILDCSDTVQSGWWSKTGGYTYVYQFSPTLNRYDAGHPIWNRVWENNVHLARVASLAACDSTSASYYVSSDATQSPTIYIHAGDDGNPASNGRTYEYANRYSGVFAYDVQRLSLDGVVCKRNLACDGSIVGGKYSRILNCQANEGQKHNVYVRTGSYVFNVSCQECYYNSNTSMFVYNDDNPNGEGISFEDCSASVTTYNSDYSAFFGHNNVSGSFGTVTFLRCTATNVYTGFGGIHADLVYTDCETTNCQHDYNINPTDNTTHTINNHVSTSNRADTRCINLIGANAVITINGYTADHSASSTHIGIYLYNHNNPTLTLNGFVYLENNNGYAVRHDGTGGTINIANCDFDTVWRYYHTISGAAAIISDYNRFRQDKTMQIQGTLYANIADYQSATGQDLHSTIG